MPGGAHFCVALGVKAQAASVQTGWLDQACFGVHADRHQAIFAVGQIVGASGFDGQQHLAEVLLPIVFFDRAVEHFGGFNAQQQGAAIR